MVLLPRLYPVGLTVDRKVSSDMVLQNHHIPAGVSDPSPSKLELLPHCLQQKLT